MNIAASVQVVTTEQLGQVLHSDKNQEYHAIICNIMLLTGFVYTLIKGPSYIALPCSTYHLQGSSFFSPQQIFEVDKPILWRL